MKDSRKELGRWGEEQAAQFLAGQGCRILERNWRARSGEIDMIAEDGECLVFIEVRTRRPSGRFGTAEESVDARKQRQVRATAQLYLHTTKQHNKSCRFDVIAITTAGKSSEEPRLRHIPNAF
jgi:putative endonuclease